MKKEIKVYLLCNTSNPKILRALGEYVPKAPSCSMDIKTVVMSQVSNIPEDVYSFNPDIILQYGLGSGLFWTQEEQIIGEKLFKVISDDHTYEQLYHEEKYMYTAHFDVIKKAILDIDLKKSWPTKIKIAKTKEDLEYIVNKCMTEPFGMDTETSFLNPFVKNPEPKLLCFSVAWLSDEEEGWCIPTLPDLIVSGNCSYTEADAKKAAEQVFFETAQPMFIHNAAFDLLVLYELFNGRQPKNFLADTMILLNLFHHAGKSCALKNNTNLINLPAYKDPIKDWIEAQPKKKGEKKAGYADVPLDIIGPYAAMDAVAVIRLFNYLKQHMDQSLWKFYYKVPHKVILTANELCWEGYTISRDRYNYTKFTLEEELVNAFDAAIESVSGTITNEFNIASPQQIGNLLYKELGLPVFAKTDKGAPSTDQKVLDDLMLFHPFIFRLSKYKKLMKVYSTYVTGYANGVLNEGSRHYIKTGNWTMNAQYKQINRTARLGNVNFSEHGGLKKRGGNILVLPSQGSMVKQYFIPRNIAEQENILYEKIVSKLSNKEKLSLSEAEQYTISSYVNPPPIKTPRITKQQTQAESSISSDVNTENDS